MQELHGQYDLTQKQILMMMSEGYELIKDDLGEWMFSGAQWRIITDGTIEGLIRAQFVHLTSQDTRPEGWEKRYSLTRKGLRAIGLQEPLVTVRRMDDGFGEAELAAICWVIVAICIAVGVVYVLLNR